MAMNGFLGSLRRLAAAVILLAGGTPTALELVLHGPDAGQPLHHIEAASVRHHADNCLRSWAATPHCAGTLVRTEVVVQPPVFEPAAVVVVPEVGRPSFVLPASRAPPRSA